MTLVTHSKATKLSHGEASQSMRYQVTFTTISNIGYSKSKERTSLLVLFDGDSPISTIKPSTAA